MVAKPQEAEVVTFYRPAEMTDEEWAETKAMIDDEVLGEVRYVDPNLKPDDRWDQKHENELLWQRTTSLQNQIKEMRRQLARLEIKVNKP